jgi:hypothetical protein
MYAHVVYISVIIQQDLREMSYHYGWLIHMFASHASNENVGFGAIQTHQLRFYIPNQVLVAKLFAYLKLKRRNLTMYLLICERKQVRYSCV